ncbi:MAG: ornithine carbamoyltransferase [Pseudomonadales bacterium]|jgi:ornithine carbamoyltransferase|nr:ornithine carbamoyltransferase [Pseudomonadales bacterium]
MAIRHFLRLIDLSSSELKALITRASELKTQQHNGLRHEMLKHRTLAMVFEKASTRTRVSFETAMIQLGGGSIFLSPNDTQLGRGEPIEDTARVLSRMCDAIMVRTFAHEKITRMAAVSKVPVINALTDAFHPCQLLADLQTYQEHRGDISGKTVCWVGDGNNMCNTFIEAAHLLDFELVVACPIGYEPMPALLEQYHSRVRLVRNPQDAVQGAALIATDVWASMGQEAEQIKRKAAFASYQVNADLMSRAASNALFLHCLPAHRGEEVSAEVIDAPDSAVWDEAENRLHAQKALLEFLLCR